jgi:DNA polymerase/3'-5' exonuclease PolX
MICGSIRRGRPKVHDIDIVILPKPVEIPGKDLFHPDSRLHYPVPKLPEWAVIERSGEKIVAGRIPLQGGGFIPFDLYICRPEEFTLIAFLKTGSKEHNIKLAKRAQELGGKLRADGSGIRLNGTLHRIDDEKQIFELLGLEYRAPAEREC